MKWFHPATFVALLALVAFGTSPAVADSITGRVTVTILDEGGTPFPGVVVTLSNTRALAPPVSVQTNPQGKAIFGVVQAGSGYRIIVEIAGYAKIQEDSISVATTPPVNLLFKLLPERVEKVVVIGERSKADLEESSSTTFSGDFLEDLPIIGNSYQAALTLAPGVQDTDGDGNPNVHGARERDFKATVDGVSNVDPLTGTFMSNINPDAIEEIEVVTEGADASYGGAVGGFAKVITKQGSNSFEGLFKFSYQSDVLNGNGAQPEPKDQFKFDYYRPGISINGPIVKDKLFYALNHDYDDIGVPVALGTGQSIIIKQTGWRHLDKLTWQVSPRNKLNFQYSADPTDVGPLSSLQGGYSSLASLDSGFNYNQGGPTYSITWQTPVNPNFNVTSILGWSDTSIGFHPITQGAINECTTDPTGQNGGRPGGSVDQDYCINQDTGRISGSFFRDYQDTRQRLTLKSDATYFAQDFIGKEHTFDFGVIGEDVHFEDDSIWYPFSLYQNLPPQLSSDGSTIKFEGGAQLFRTTYSPGSPDNVNRSADGKRYGVYIQDTFRPHPRVSIKAGVRLDYEKISGPGFVPFDVKTESKSFFRVYNGCFVNPGEEDACTSIALGNFTGYEDLPANSDLKPYVDSGAVIIRQPGSMNIDNLNLGPRVNASWDPKGDGKTKVFGTYGRGFGEIFLGIPTSEQGPNQFNEIFDVRYVTTPDPTQPGGVRFVPTVDASPNSTSSPSVTIIDRNLRTPYVDEYSIGITRELFSETSINLTYIHRDYKDQLQDIDANHYAQDKGKNSIDCVRIPESGLYIPQGKPDGKFDDCAGESVIIGSEGLGGKPVRGEKPDGIPDLFLRNPYFNQIFQIGNYNSEQYRAYKLELVRRMHHNWEMEASYVWSKAVGQAEDYAQQSGDDPTTIQDESGYVGYDQRHVIKINARTIIPVIGVTMGIITGWESGQPYSINEVGASLDRNVAFGQLTKGYNQIRTTFPSHQRNDHRNDSYFDLALSAQKEFRIKDVNLTTIIECDNVLNDDTRFVGVVRNGSSASFRQFGRQFEFVIKVNF